MKLPSYISPVLDPMAWKQDSFQHPWNDLSAFAFHRFALLRQALSGMMLSTNLPLVLVALLWLQEWFTDHLPLLVGEPLELASWWNLLVQPHVRKFHRSLETLCLHTWEFSSDSSARLGFQRRLQFFFFFFFYIISDDPQLVSTRESGLDSSIGVKEGIYCIYICARPLFCRYQNSSCIY